MRTHSRNIVPHYLNIVVGLRSTAVARRPFISAVALNLSREKCFRRPDLNAVIMLECFLNEARGRGEGINTMFGCRNTFGAYLVNDELIC